MMVLVVCDPGVLVSSRAFDMALLQPVDFFLANLHLSRVAGGTEVSFCAFLLTRSQLLSPLECRQTYCNFLTLFYSAAFEVRY